MCQRIHTQEPGNTRVIDAESIVLLVPLSLDLVVVLLAIEPKPCGVFARCSPPSSRHLHAERVVVASVDDFGILRGIAERACRTRHEQVADRHAHVAEMVGQFVALCAGMTVLLGFELCKGAGGIPDVALLDAKTTAGVDVYLGLHYVARG